MREREEGRSEKARINGMLTRVEQMGPKRPETFTTCPNSRMKERDAAGKNGGRVKGQASWTGSWIRAGTNNNRKRER